MPHHPGTRLGQNLLMQQLPLVGAGDDQRHSQPVQIKQQLIRLQPFVQFQRKVRTHACAQYLGRPQRGRAFECDHLLHSERGSAAQHRADVARILHAVKNKRLHLRQWGDLRRQIHHKTHGCRRPQRTDLGKELVGNRECFGSGLRQSWRCRRIVRVGEYGNCRNPATLQGRTAKVVAFEPYTAQPAVGGGLFTELAQRLEQRVVSRGDVRYRRHDAIACHGQPG